MQRPDDSSFRQFEFDPSKHYSRVAYGDTTERVGKEELPHDLGVQVGDMVRSSAVCATSLGRENSRCEMRGLPALGLSGASASSRLPATHYDSPHARNSPAAGQDCRRC
eukprot:6154667-Amphidinium_carterae.4